MRVIQCFGGIGANVVEVSQEFIDGATTGFQTYVVYNAQVHASFMPRDRVTVNGVDPTRRLAIEAAIVNLYVVTEQLKVLESKPETTQQELDAKKIEVQLAETARDNAEKL